MSAFEAIMQLTAVVVLLGLLCLKHRQRVRYRAGLYDSTKWNGRPIDVTKLKPTVEDVRRDYLAARQSAKGVCYHRCLLRLARRSVTRFAYFQDHEPHEPAKEPDHYG